MSVVIVQSGVLDVASIVCDRLGRQCVGSYFSRVEGVREGKSWCVDKDHKAGGDDVYFEDWVKGKLERKSYCDIGFGFNSRFRRGG